MLKHLRTFVRPFVKTFAGTFALAFFLVFGLNPSLTSAEQHYQRVGEITYAGDVSQRSAVAPHTEPSAKVVARGFPALSQRTAVEKAGAGAKPTADTPLSTPGITVASSLAVVLGLFAGFVWLTRRFGTSGSAKTGIPKDVLQNLGSTSIDARTNVTLLRCGARIIVIAQTPTGVQTLSEITDPNEVISITAQCVGDSKRAFASTLVEFEKLPAEKGFVGAAEEPPIPTARSRGRLFASA